MSFSRIDGVLHAEQCSLDQLAMQYGTPLYVYSKATFEKHYLDMDKAFSFIDHQICFAVKSNSNLAVLNVLAKLGCGFDIVTGGELARVLAAGGDPSKIVFSGLGKQEEDIQKALEVGIACFNVESHAELDRIQNVAARLGQKAPISLRVNPDVDAKTHPYISTGLKENKFGIPSDVVFETYQYAASLPNLDVVGIDCHIGSQLTETQPFVDALDRIMMMIEQLKTLGIHLQHIDIGGGLGVTYKDETPPSVVEYAESMRPALEKLGLKVYMEPGRSISANAGVLLTKVDLLKPTQHRNFAIIDAAMNDLIRPSLYEAWMDIQPVKSRTDVENKTWDIVGAICETGDFLGKARELALKENDHLAVLGAGAYGFVMSSNYNSRGRAAEVMVDGEQSHVIRKRESIESLWENERLLP
ncbi:diaminopimelate decarboxylase [Acinetobacter bereziniae]|jgi:diaminopimelate decarboxylase|uniref:Diaminopimelate decarboxylase n=1 Tax=Acinetobacter bereziniae LMG 1003 = CIP 70.12 TaxID=981324 RepID=N9DH48_ACIBZ|nr:MULTISPECIES: diaminopimelate decarboxylase [Acinetobacter]MEC8123001.1 diaminopimelate decarboxylase [Pseudomonadota bacterium]ATZ62811.1 diaminopimelate decarboxylase [Acinetobacter bereziniae]ENV97126.1 diaminopimelate decarboxylase [Acinetobacter bereziniae LMG 1003 = CIP 70.12]MBJ8444231.1 diaminopimelate decarboxylase [Acinetobacter bereziniae]MBJ8450466.1 diaminopimelate decarboxylase [Acinetobacter bereziniae]